MGPDEFIVELVDLEGSRINNGWGCIKYCTDACSPNKIRGSNPLYRSSKSMGEPPLLLAYSILSALRWAVLAARSPLMVHPLFAMPLPARPDLVSALCWHKYINLLHLNSIIEEQ